MRIIRSKVEAGNIFILGEENLRYKIITHNSLEFEPTVKNFPDLNSSIVQFYELTKHILN